jgi:crotonobetainyl-CoA:carnitine CoA-transferase CaiB-like acyl-CoA transferase
MPRPLAHIRVLDLSRVLAGPWASQNLADLGAEVIKVERPGTGDDTRGWGPPWLKDRDGKDTRESSYYLSCNRGKKSMTLDISKPEGQSVVRALAAKCDVLIENYKVGTLARYGLGYEQLREINRASSTARSPVSASRGRMRHVPDDFVFQGMGGLMSITGERDDLPGGGPMKVGIAITDILTGMYASLAITAAIAHCERAAAASISTWRCSIPWSRSMPTRSAATSSRATSPGATAMPIPTSCPTRFPCKDGHLILAVGNDSQFASLQGGRPELAEDERFRLMSGRIVNRDELVPLIAGIMRTRGMHE